MNRPSMVVILFALMCVPGCITQQVRNRTLDLTTTTTDLFYGQVVDNIARLVDDPAALPYFDAPTQGTAQVLQTITASYTPSWDFITTGVYIGRYLFDKQSANVGATCTTQDNWQVSALVNPDKIFLMQAAYQRLLGKETPQGETALEEYYAARMKQLDKSRAELGWPTTPSGTPLPKSLTEAQDKKGTDKPGSSLLPVHVPYREFIQPAPWFNVGKKSDVPKCAGYVGHHCNTYVWVCPDQLDGLAKFTLAILDLYTIENLSAPRSTPYMIPPPPASIR